MSYEKKILDSDKDKTKRVIDYYTKHKDTRITSKLLDMEESEVRYLLSLSNIKMHKKKQENNVENKYYKYNNQHMHRTIMSAYLGRKLKFDEYVHHIDFDKSNNYLSNLVLVSPVQHSDIERQTRYVLKALIHKGVITFDKEKLFYLINS